MYFSRLKPVVSVALVCGMILVAQGCSKKPDADATADLASTSGTDTSAFSTPIRGGSSEGEGIRMPDLISEGRTSGPMLPVYFDYDSFSIKSDMSARMQTNVRFLQDNPKVTIEVQGNCDERGTNEYNLALGEKRAKSVKSYLVNMGIKGERVEVVSLGEEQPLDPGHTESAWTKNRRADFVIVKK